MAKNNWTPADLEKLGVKVTGSTGKITRSKKRKVETPKSKATTKPRKRKLKGDRTQRPIDGWVIEIKGEVPSSKNSRIITYQKDSDGNPKFYPNGELMTVSLPSKATKRYIDERLPDYIRNKAKFQEIIKQKQPPYQVWYKVLRFRNDVWDYHNAVQIIADMMVKAEWIEDDDRENLQINLIPYTLVATPEEAGVVLIF